jgi:exosome complex RNA-binding protein Rrp42 (RNase PH superfamily)
MYAGKKKNWMISQSEIAYLVDGIKQGIRTDGRSCDSLRPITIDMGVVPTANGSCRVRSKACDIFVAIKCDIGIPTAHEPDMGILSVSVEFGCSVLSRVHDLSGRQAVMESEAIAEVVSHQIESLCLRSVDRTKFCIEPKRACWVVSIDVLVERVDGPLIDPISIGVRAALMDLELPVVSVPPPEAESVADSFPRVDLLGGLWKMSPNNLSAICVSVGVFCDNSIIAVDLDRIEESIAKFSNNSLISVSVNEDGTCFGVHKWGSGAIDPAVLKAVVNSASNVGKQIALMMTKVVA